MNRILIALTAALFAVIGLVPSAQAGGSGDFYKHVYCAVGSAGDATLDITNYDIATGQRYHMDMDATNIYTPYALYVDGVKQAGWNDRYKDFANRGGVHTIKGVWYKGDPSWAATASCTRTL